MGKKVKEIVKTAAELAFKIWLCGRPFRVSKEVFDLIQKCSSEKEALKIVENNNL